MKKIIDIIILITVLSLTVLSIIGESLLGAGIIENNDTNFWLIKSSIIFVSFTATLNTIKWYLSVGSDAVKKGRIMKLNSIIRKAKMPPEVKKANRILRKISKEELNAIGATLSDREHLKLCKKLKRLKITHREYIENKRNVTTYLREIANQTIENSREVYSYKLSKLTNKEERKPKKWNSKLGRHE